MTHFLEVCEHGITIRQCRCPGPKQKRVVPCPYPEHESAVDQTKADTHGDDAQLDELLAESTTAATLMVSSYFRLPYLPEALVACSRCAATVPYDDVAMTTHDKFHAGLDAVKTQMRRVGPIGPIGGQ